MPHPPALVLLTGLAAAEELRNLFHWALVRDEVAADGEVARAARQGAE